MKTSQVGAPGTLALAAALCATALSSPATAQQMRTPMSQPAVSPDGREIAFVAHGDIWTVPAAGGTATLLVSHERTEARPRWSPDGTRLAFVSDRNGDDDIYVLTLATGVIARLTFGDGNEELDGWSPDGDWIYLADGRDDPGGQPDIWRVRSTGGTPMPVLADEYAPEFHAAVAPDGRTIAIAAKGRMAQGQWWRNGHSHIDESEIWLVTLGDPPRYVKLSESGSKNVQPMWIGAGREVAYVSDRSGSENLWAQPAAGGAARRLTSFESGRVLFPDASADGSLITFERDFGVWTMALPDGRPAAIPITLRGAPQRPDPEHLDLSSGFGDLALSPDGKKVAFTARGEVFAASASDGGKAARVTHSLAAESDVTWAPDSRRIAYVSRRDGRPSVFLYDFANGEEVRVTDAEGADVTPRFSPDGKRLVYARDGRELRVRDLDTHADVRVAEGLLEVYPYTSPAPIVWSPDGAWIAYLTVDERQFSNVWLVSADGGDARRVSGLANSFAGSIAWSPDGETLYFDTQHRTQTGQVASVDLVPRTPVFHEDKFTDLFVQPAPPSGGIGGSTADAEAETPTATVTPDFTDIRRRLSLLPIGVDVGTLALSPDGKTLVFNASAEGNQNLYAFSVDRESTEDRVTRQVTSTSGFKSTPIFTPDGKEVLYLASGRIQRTNVESGQTRPLAVNAELDIDFDQVKLEAFDQGWSYMRDHFYDAGYHGADWEAVRRTFEPVVRGASTRAEYSRLMNLMMGELNGSHLGHNAGGGPSGSATSALGLRWDRAEYEDNGRLRVSEVLPLGPAQVAGGIEVGNYVVSVAGTAVGTGFNIDQALQNRSGDKVVLRVSASANGQGATDVSVQPVSPGAERRLEYRDWVETNRAYVEAESDGRLGYVHMPDMGQGSLDQLFVDLDAENHDKAGVVIDIRNNNGGFVNAYALDAFARRGYITMQVRGYPEANARSMLGQRSLELGTVLVINQNTLSDGEDFTEGYRTLGLGQVVGEPTAGWIVFTWSAGLVDGTSVRMPRAMIRGADGTDMELNPRPVDVSAVRPMGESYSGRDSQLDVAIRVLLGGE